MSNNYSTPQIMIRLCNISYDFFMSSIPQDVNDQLGLNVVWGPAERTHDLVSDSRMFVVNGPGANDFTVVIRGTNMISWESWTSEDFAISSVVNFNTYVPTAPADAVISQGTSTGMDWLNGLTDPNTGLTVVQFLQNQLQNGGIGNLYVTGHSLGGTLTPPYFTYLVNEVYGKPSAQNCFPMSFAGLTPGNAAFNNFFQTYIQSGLVWRYVNPLDMAPNCWWSLENLQNLYAANGLSWGWPEDSFLENLFTEGAPFGYVQPNGGELTLPSVFNSDFPDDDSWVLQAAYQHHGTTYTALIDQVS